jgi:hypothetical protein
MAKGLLRLRRIWLPSFFGRLTFLLFSLSLLTLYFYVVGNSQGFTDRTLIFLFAVESWTLAICALSAVFSTVAYAATLPFRNRLQLDRIIFSAAAAIFSVLLYLVVALLQAFMESYG